MNCQIPHIITYPHGVRHAHTTDIPSPSTLAPLTLTEYALYDLHETTQREKLWGFTVRELQACGAWSKPDAKPNDLASTIPIHPLLERSQWLVSEQPMGNGGLGNWCARTNDMLWEALVPVLRLAGLLLMKTESIWQDAMWNGEWFPVVCEDGCPIDSAYRQAYEFWPRKPYERADEDWQATLSQFRSIMIDRVKFCFEDRPGEPDQHYGYMQPKFLESKDLQGNPVCNFQGTVVLCTDYMVSLLTEAMSPSERLAQSHFMAKTIVHECMHASMCLARELRPMPIKGCEPFFENESMAEAGFSWENTAFGGSASHIHSTMGLKTYNPILGEFITPWPNFHMFGAGLFNDATGQRCRDSSQFQTRTARFEQWPVSMTYIENLQQAGFWSGHPIPEEALKGPQILGKCILNDGNILEQNFKDRQYTVLGKDYYRWALGPAGQVQAVQERPINQGDSVQLGYELALATRAATIRVSMMRKEDKEFRERNIAAIRNDTTLTPLDLAELHRLAVKKQLLDHRHIKDEEKKLELAKQYYDPTNETQSRDVYEHLIRSDNRSTCAIAALRLSQMITVPLLEQIKICQKAIDELTILLEEELIWYFDLDEAKERMRTLIIQRDMSLNVGLLAFPGTSRSLGWTA